MNTPHYLCLRSSKVWQTRKGWVYVREGNELVHYSTRWQTRLLNAAMMIVEAGLLTPIADDMFPLGANGLLCNCDDCK